MKVETKRNLIAFALISAWVLLLTIIASQLRAL